MGQICLKRSLRVLGDNLRIRILTQKRIRIKRLGWAFSDLITSPIFSKSRYNLSWYLSLWLDDLNKNAKILPAINDEANSFKCFDLLLSFRVLIEEERRSSSLGQKLRENIILIPAHNPINDLAPVLQRLLRTLEEILNINKDSKPYIPIKNIQNILLVILQQHRARNLQLREQHLRRNFHKRLIYPRFILHHWEYQLHILLHLPHITLFIIKLTLFMTLSVLSGE